MIIRTGLLSFVLEVRKNGVENEMRNGYHTPEIPDNMELDCTQTNGDADWRRTGRTNSCYGSDSVDQEHF